MGGVGRRDADAADGDDWAVVVPVKDPAASKTRLTGLGSADRRDLAVALARSTIARVCAAVGPGRCFVVAPTAVHAMLGGQAHLVTDPDDGLNTALVAGRDAAMCHGHTAVALLVADLPLLTADALTAALRRVPQQGTGLVRDVCGRGTTLLAARTARDLVPSFEGESARRHLGMWAYDLSTVVGPGVRQDLDTDDDLHAVLPQLAPDSPVADWANKHLAAMPLSTAG